MTTKQDFLAAADKHGVGHAGKSLWRWIERGTTPGGFLTAVLCNDLTKAVDKADDRNVELIPNYVKLLYNHAPADCWGSEDKVGNWQLSWALQHGYWPHEHHLEPTTQEAAA